MPTKTIDPRRIEVVDDAVAAILRTKTPAEKAEMIFQCNRTMRLVIEGSIRTSHPDWTDAQVQADVVRRMLRGTG